MTPYILNVALIIAGCLAFYKLFLQRETFYRVNRYMLIACLIIAFALPLIPVPQQWSFRQAEEKTSITQMPASQIILPLDPNSVQRKETSGTTPQETTSTTTSTPFSIQMVFNWMFWLYWFGVIAFGFNLLLQIVVLFYRAHRGQVIIDGRYRIVEVSGDKAPCSFANIIFINPEKYEWETYNQILMHEKVHVRQKHSMDLLLAELVLIFQWFNPFAWIYRKEMENNLEFLTDDHLVQREAIEKSSYQMSLLKVSSPQLPLSVTTNYNQSLLKKRIAMMNAKKSNLHTAWKYFFLLPVLVLFACLLNEPFAYGQTDTKVNKDIQVENKQNINVNSNQDVKVNTKQNVNTNNNQNITVDTKQNINVDTKQNINVDTKQSINVDTKVNTKNEKGIVVNGEMDLEGSWFATIKGDKVNMQFRNDDDEHNSFNNNSTFKLSELPELPRGSSGTFKITRDAGVLELTGKFEGDQGMGKYKFVPNKQYAEEMNKELDETLKDRDLMVFFFIDIKKSYVAMLKNQGYNDISKKDIIPLAALKIDAAYISSLKESGLKDLSLRDLIPLKSLGIDKDYIEEIRKAGFEDITADELIPLKAQGIDGAYISKVRKASNSDDFKPRDIIALKSLKIDEAYINSFRAVGYDHISNKDLIPMKSLGITAEYIKGFQAIGYNDLRPSEFIPLKSQKITPDFIKGFTAIGYKNIPIHDIVSLKAVGVTPAYVKEMQGKGFKYDRLNKYITLKSIEN